MPPTLVTYGPANPWLSDALLTKERWNATRTGCRERGAEFDISSRAVLTFTTADTVVAGRDEEAEALRTELCEQVAQGRHILRRENIFIRTIRYAYCLRKFIFIQTEHVFETLEVRVSKLCLPAGLSVRFAADAVVDKGCWIRYGRGVLDIHAPLVGGRAARVVYAAVDRYRCELRIHRVGAKFPHERLQIILSR